jgi:iron-sulfur cluster repair protein YtfE (RIC family)
MDAHTPDLTYTLLEHRAMRVDASRLANHLRTVTPPDALRHSQAATNWYRRFQSTIHDHHRFESEFLFPALTELAPEFAEIDVRLEHEHDELEDRLSSGSEAYEALIDVVGSSTWKRAHNETVDAMDGLVEIINRHLDHEESLAFPILNRVLPAADYRRLMSRGTRAISVRGIVFTGPWVLEKAEQEEADHVLSTLPRPLSWIYRRRWEPKYRRLVHDAGLPDVTRAQGAACVSALLNERE